jgi:hypothetical protein
MGILSGNGFPLRCKEEVLSTVMRLANSISFAGWDGAALADDFHRSLPVGEECSKSGTSGMNVPTPPAWNPLMPQWMQDLTQGWPLISANIPTFVVIVVLMLGVVWAAFNWSYGAIISRQAAEIKLLERQKAEAIEARQPQPAQAPTLLAKDTTRGKYRSGEGRLARGDGG